MRDAINPDHYKRLDPEPIVVIEKWGLGFCLGNALKYISRAGHKPGATTTDDILKARWYVDRALAGDHGVGDVDLAARNDVLTAELADARAEVRQWKIAALALADSFRTDGR